MQKEIKKSQPKFIKLGDVRPGRHGYNVYLKVLKASHEQAKRADGSTLEICEAQLGDETATINARIVGKYAPLLIQDKVVAIRNGRSEVYMEHHRLEIDLFGKVSQEEVQINSIGQKNMSATVYETRIVQQ